MIEPCTPVWETEWATLRHALWPQETCETHRQEVKELLADPNQFGQFVFVGTAGEAQGFVEIALRSDYVNGTSSSPVAFLEGIYVKPECRGRGIARTLVIAAEQWAKQHGCQELASDALLDNTSSHEMHRSLGFDETERVVYFRKSLPEDPKNSPANNKSCD